MLHWIYIGITFALGVIILFEMFREKHWHQHLAYALILVPLILRILHIK